MGTNFTLFDTTIGACALVWGEHGLVGAALPEPDAAATRDHVQQRFPGSVESAAPAPQARLIARVVALLDGTPDDLADIALDLRGMPDFNRRVYAITRSIQPGRTLTYGEVAARLGEGPQAARAVGQALGANPIPIIVPCHRVLAAGSQAGGFSAPGGTRTKLRLLEIEGARFGGSPGLFDA
jgi:methylated-DNA-[protein]-cysteine S-methyltransferase